MSFHSRRTHRPRRAFVVVLILSLAALAAGLVSQHVFNMQPCAWCVLQRAIYVGVAFWALLGIAWRAPMGRWVGGGGAAILALCGLAAALWQHFVAAATESCKLTLADKIVHGLGLDSTWPEVFAPRASCAEAAVNLLGVPYAYWSAAVFAVLFIGACVAARGRRRWHP